MDFDVTLDPGGAAPGPLTRKSMYLGTASTMGLLAVASTVPPDLGRAVSIADRVRRAVMSRTTWLGDDGRRLHERRPDPDPLISGRSEDGAVLRGHPHAFWLPFASDPRGRQIDRLLVVVRGGLSPRAVAGLRSLRRVWGDDQYDLHTTLLGLDDDARAGCPDLVREAAEWHTDTPFVPTRHPKRDRDGIDDQIRTAVVQLGLPAPVEVSPLGGGLHEMPWHMFQTVRRGGGSRSQRGGVGVRLVFSDPVGGPIAIGWGAHFGMGRFRAIR